MPSITEQQIHVLNGLILTTLDSANGYGDAAKDAQKPHFKRMFVARALERQLLTAELQTEVRSLGGKAQDDGSLLAAGYRAFLNLKNAVTGSDETVIDEVERGEDYIKGKYEAALQAGNLTDHIQTVVANAYERVKAGHDDIRDIKHELKARSC
ncbi:MAG: PA2169 family four-helix-bundle protein [Rhodospirillaceae bacterium]